MGAKREERYPDGVFVLRCTGAQRVFDLSEYRHPPAEVFTHRAYMDALGDGGYEQRRALVALITAQGYAPEIALSRVYPGLTRDVEGFLRARADVPAEDARLHFFADTTPRFIVYPERDGRTADRPRLYRDLALGLMRSKATTAAVCTNAVKPAVTARMLNAQTHLRARFSTPVAASTEDRRHNVRLALSAFNGLCIPAGTEVSFNALVGARTAARGYRESKIIVDGRFEEGIGGGVCQASTTLYNAALLADLTVKANRHTLPVAYVLPSFDAMVNAGSSDLKIKNGGTAPVYVRTGGDEGSVFVEIYGTRLPYKIVRKSVTTDIVPHTGYETVADTEGKHAEKVFFRNETAVLSEPKDGLKSEGYLLYYDGKTLLNEKKIRTDAYRPTKGVIVQGTH
jgi:vancomycin resistance protein YoaR